MKIVLDQLNCVPGVVGSLVSDREGRVLAQAFPPLFDAGLLEEAARLIAEQTVGLELMTGSVGMIDYRYANSRIVARFSPNITLFVLCTKAINLQLLVISAAVAVKKLLTLVEEPGAAMVPAERAGQMAPAPAAPAPAPAAPTVALASPHTSPEPAPAAAGPIDDAIPAWSICP